MTIRVRPRRIFGIRIGRTAGVTAFSPAYSPLFLLFFFSRSSASFVFLTLLPSQFRFFFYSRFPRQFTLVSNRSFSTSPPRSDWTVHDTGCHRHVSQSEQQREQRLVSIVAFRGQCSVSYYPFSLTNSTGLRGRNRGWSEWQACVDRLPRAARTPRLRPRWLLN